MTVLSCASAARRGAVDCWLRRTAIRCAEPDRALEQLDRGDAALHRFTAVVSVGSARPPRRPVRRAHTAPAVEPDVDLVLLRGAVRDRRGSGDRLRVRHDHRPHPDPGAQRSPTVARVAAGAASQSRSHPHHRRAADPLSRRPRRRHAAAARRRGNRAVDPGERRTDARGSAGARTSRASGTTRSTPIASRPRRAVPMERVRRSRRTPSPGTPFTPWRTP